MPDFAHKPVSIIAIEPNAANVVRYGDDKRLQRDYDVTITAEDFDRLRSGWMCAQCYEPFASAFPVKCPVCNFEVADRQIEWLTRIDHGEKWIGSRETLADELERLEEDNERAIRAKRGSSQIILPRGVVL